MWWKDYKKFLNKMEQLKPYLVEFDENDKMKNKTYLSDCMIGGEERRPIIVITHNKCIFSVNDGIFKTQTRIRNTFFYPKG